MTLTLFSFGHKHGPPLGADMVFDARLLPNPFWVPELKEFHGTEPRVASYVLANDAGRQFLALLLPLLRHCVAEYEKLGKEALTVAVGCTGGRHRSVAVVEELARQLTGIAVLEVTHRDIEKG